MNLRTGALTPPGSPPNRPQSHGWGRVGVWIGHMANHAPNERTPLESILGGFVVMPFWVLLRLQSLDDLVVVDPNREPGVVFAFQKVSHLL